MPTELVGQNGAEIKQNTKIAVTGCPKHKKAARHTKTSMANTSTSTLVDGPHEHTH